MRLRDPGERGDARQESFRTEGLGHEVVGPVLPSLDLLMVLTGGREDQAGEGRPASVGPHPVEDGDPPHAGHHEVEDHQLDRRIVLEGLDGICPIVGEGDRERSLFELGLDDPADVRLVVGDEDVNGRHRHGVDGMRSSIPGPPPKSSSFSWHPGVAPASFHPVPLTPAARRRRALIPLLVAALFGGGLTACDDPFQLQAQYPNIDRSFELWAVTGTSATYPSAVIVTTASASQLDAAGSFDFAIDIDADGRLVILPVSKLVQPLIGSRVVAMQRSSTPYTQLLEAPRTGWLPDTTLLVNPGGVFMVKINSLACQYSQSADIYAKFIVDSIDPVGRRAILSARVNPNCGFRSFVAGLPEY